MIEPRIYRAAFIPAVLAVVVVMFWLESRPRPLGQGLPADVVFAGASAVTTTGTILDAARDRRAGRPGDRDAAGLVARSFRDRGFTVEVDRFERDGDDLVNVIGRRAGSSRRQIVVIAARDAAGVPDAGGSAADTAALIELARVFEGRPSNKTLVLASVDGATLGELGTRELVERLNPPGLVDGVVVMSGLGEPESARPAVVAWSGDVTSGGIGLQRTAAESIRQELGAVAPAASPIGQLARLAFPLGIGPQGVLIAEGYDAVRIAGAGELGASGETELEDVDENRLGGLGRAALRTVTALDQGRRAEHGPETHITIVSQVMPGWAPSLLALALILPVLVASIDAFARARRRNEPVLPWLVWVGAGAMAVVVGILLVHALALTGALREPFEAPVAPDLYPLDGGAIAALVVVAAVVAAAWVGLRFLAARARGLLDPSAPGAAVATALVLAGSVLVLWVVNPFAALLMAPALHLWTLATLVDPPPPRRGRMLMIAGGLLLPALLAIYVLASLSMDPVSGAWYLLLLVAGGHVGLLTTLLWAALAAGLGSAWAIARAGDPPREEPVAPVSVRGPASYAGPGSLGGTDSAL